jgi:hypothetical protein
MRDGINCRNLLDLAAADLIENQQRHIEALMKANAGLRDTVLRRDAQIADMSDGLAQFAKAVAVKEENNAELLEVREGLQSAKNAAEQYAAINETLFDSNMKLGADRKALINELCQYCGKYKQAHEGACDGCRWREK